jgi:2-polyprenyl-6-methoxyphenol hydroxylase-like FAD-dependent oxidoreductase
MLTDLLPLPDARPHYAWYVLAIVTLIYLFSFLYHRIQSPIREASIGECRMPESVLVSGAGVAGACLAWWLDRYGYAVTLVEQAPEPRTGGYVIDFWGLGFDVAEKMGVLDELRRHDLKVQEFRIVNRVGRRISGFNQGEVQKLIKGRGMSLPRSALASALYEAVKDRVDVRFGNSVTSLEDSPRGVEVTLREGEAQTFDLVIGADGLHSGVRRLCFGE